MKKLLVFCLLFSFCVFFYSGVQAAMQTGDTWDDGQLHDWRGNTAWTRVSIVDSGGNPGGFLLSKSDPQGNPSKVIGADSEEERYTGNYTSAAINRIGFDFRVLSGSVGKVVLRMRYHNFEYNGWYYPFDLNNTPGTVTKLEPFDRWTHFEVSFDPNWTDAQATAAGWKQENHSASFHETMSDVYTLEVRVSTPDTNATQIGIDNFNIYSSRAGGTNTTKSGASDIATRFTGWWYDQQEQGTGLALEIQGQRLFAAWFVFDESGNSTWYTTGGNLTEENMYFGDVLRWEGWPWGQPYQQPVPERAGNATIVLNQGGNGTVTYSAVIEGVTVSKNLTSFMADFAPGARDSRNLTGWWYDPAYQGMGFFIDARGGTMAMVWYNYRGDGNPRWWTSTGPFSDGAQIYSGSLDGWKGGQCLGCPYQMPQQMEGEGGTISINFIDSTHATAEVNGTTLHIERFNIPAR